jgi:hypothetical protein
MNIFEFPFPIEIGAVCDVDFSSSGETVSIQGTGNHQVLIKGEERWSLPDAWTSPEFPFVRHLPDGRVLVVDSGFDAEIEKNAWIIGDHGRVQANFSLGSAAVEISVLWGMIAVAYHPISAKAHGYQIQPQQRLGIAFFDFQGRMIMGFNPESAAVGVSVDNVRCMTALSRSQLLFVPERLFAQERDQTKEIENPIVLFDCATRRPTVYSAPFPRSEAVAMSGEWIHLASPEGWEDQIVTFSPTLKTSHHRGEFLGIYRGLEGGSFVSQLSSSDYAVISPETPEIKSPTRTLADRPPELTV